MMQILLPPIGYMNPGTGSLILQVVLAGVASLFLGLKSVWSAIRSFRSRNKK